jgi:hypothetical protein
MVIYVDAANVCRIMIDAGKPNEWREPGRLKIIRALARANVSGRTVVMRERRAWEIFPDREVEIA